MIPYHVPSGATISRLRPQILPHYELQDAIKESFKYKKQVIDTAICLLSLLTKPSLTRPEVMLNLGSLASEDSWILNILTRLWEAIAPEGAQLDYVESTLSNVVSLLDCIHEVVTRTSGFDSRLVVINRLSILYSRISTTFLVTEPLPLSSPIEKKLCLMFFHLAPTNPKSGPKLQSFAGNTLSKFLKVRHDHKRFDAFGQDLQVRKSRYSS